MRGVHMNLLDLGGLLKQERERRGLTVRDVMDATKISRRNLNALEDGAVKLLPHPVYLKGYVRNYARMVGLDPEPLVAIVDQQSDGDSGYVPQVPSPAPPAPVVAVPEQPEPIATPAEPEPQPAPEAGSLAEPPAEVTAEPVPPTVPEPVGEAPAEPVAEPVAAPVSEQPAEMESQIRFPKPADLSPKPRRRVWPWLLLLILVAGGSALVYQCQRIQNDAPPAAPMAAQAPADNATNATDMNATDSNASLPEANATASEPIPALAPAAAAPSASVPSAMPEFKTGGPSTAPTGPSAVVSSPSIEVSRKAPAAAPVAEVRTSGMQELVVLGKPGEVCWVEVSEGQRRKTFTLRDGDSRRFEFSHKAKVRLGNAGGVTLQLNGSHYPFEGQRGQTASFEIGGN
jgi:cytoskeleton protein RodZ